MVQNAEEDGVARLASESDHRILPVGRFLRMTRLDELPQLINILKGEMSVVVRVQNVRNLQLRLRRRFLSFPIALKSRPA